MRLAPVWTLVLLALTAGISQAADEPQELLYIIDDSSSMLDQVSIPGVSRGDRWTLLQSSLPPHLSSLSADVAVGAISVGGDCRDAPSIRLPVGIDRGVLLGQFQNHTPGGSTNLNAALLEVPELFDLSHPAQRRVVLWSDGANTCKPQRSTCDIAKELYEQHGIVVDVVAWATEPKALAEYRCIARVTTGQLQTGGAPSDADGGKGRVTVGLVEEPPAPSFEAHLPPLPLLDPWIYVVLVLGTLTVFAGGRLLYRHGLHAREWSPARSWRWSALLVFSGVLMLYATLFYCASAVAALIGLGLILALMSWVARPKRAPTANKRTQRTAGAFIALMLSVSLIGDARGEEPSAEVPDPRFHHILVLDASGSVRRVLPAMKSLFASYAEMYAVPGEEISLVLFGTDAQGTVVEMDTFTVPPEGPSRTLNRLLDDVKIQTSTNTYNQPLADFLGQFLGTVRLDPVIIIAGDGKSDDRQDITFESLGTQGVYQAPNTRTWKVAVVGGQGLDLSLLFQKPIPPRQQRGQQSRKDPLSPPIDPCLIQPGLRVEVPGNVFFHPPWRPFSGRLLAEVPILVSNECVVRNRTWELQLVQGQRTTMIGKVDNIPIGTDPMEFTFQAERIPGQGDGDAFFQILLEEGRTSRTVFPVGNPRVQVQEMTFRPIWAWVPGLALLCGCCFIFGIRKRRTKLLNAPLPIDVVGGQGTDLEPGLAVPAGGEGNPVVLPQAEPGEVLCYVSWPGGDRTQVDVRPESDVRAKVNGNPIMDRVSYALGSPLVLEPKDGRQISFKFLPGRKRRGKRGLPGSGGPGRPTPPNDFNFGFGEEGASGNAGPLI